MTRIEALAVHLFSQLDEGEWSQSTLELIEDAIRHANEEGRRRGRQAERARVRRVVKRLRDTKGHTPASLCQPAYQLACDALLHALGQGGK